MRMTPVALTALAATAAAQSTKPCEAADGVHYNPLWGSSIAGRLIKPIRSLVAKPDEPQHEIEARALAGYTNLGTRYNKCLDVTAGIYCPGTRLQIWECASGNKNQAAKFTGGNLRVAGGYCVDVPGGQAYPGAEMQIWPCQQGNKNQLFEQVGTNVRFKGSSFCLDVKDGRYDSGRPIQLYPCYQEPNMHQGNQHWWMGGQPRGQSAAPAKPAAQAPVSAGEGQFAGAQVVSIDRFCSLHPECAPHKQAFISAGNAKGVHPTLVASIAMQESTCNAYPPGPNGIFGLMQFMSDAAWNHYKGSPGASKTNAYDATYAGANYIRSLLDAHGWNLDAALREYNGPINQGGKPSYQAEIRAWMRGDWGY